MDRGRPCLCDDDHPVSAVSFVSGRQGDSQICGVSGEDAALCHHWAFGGVLSEGCAGGRDFSRASGDDRGVCDRGASLVEGQFFVKHRRGDRGVYGVGAEGVCVGMRFGKRAVFPWETQPFWESGKGGFGVT